MIKNRKTALIFRVIAALISFIGILLHFNILGKPNFGIIVYYTMQSNIIICMMFIYLSIKTYKELKKEDTAGYASYHERIKGALMLMITITFLIFLGLLAPNMIANGMSEYLWAIDNHLVHTITPLLAIFDYILFDKNKQFKKYDPFIWTIIPLVYFGFAIIRAQFLPYVEGTSRYPYFFIDFDQYGLQVILHVVLILMFFIGLGYLIRYLDAFRNKKKQRT